MVVVAHVWSDPADTLAQVPDAGEGTVVSPHALDPQHCSCPVVVVAHVWADPADTLAVSAVGGPGGTTTVTAGVEHTWLKVSYKYPEMTKQLYEAPVGRPVTLPVGVLRGMPVAGTTT